MSISIVACPRCATLLLHDTVQCHRCKHIIRPDRVGELRESALPSDDAVQKDLEKCKQCGETYRTGLVRCWSCGAFTRPEIEAAYYRLLRGHARSLATAGQRTDLKELTEEEARQSYEGDDDLSPLPVGDFLSPDVSAVDQDFELSHDILLRDDVAVPPPVFDSSEDDFELDGPGLSDIPPLSEIPPIQLTPSTEFPVIAPPLPEENADSSPPETIPLAAPIPSLTVQESPAAPVEPPPVQDETDSLLNIAKQEEVEAVQSRRVKKQRRVNEGDGFIVYCPMGCKIRVQERHRGKMGRCPKCQTIFLVPMAKQQSFEGSLSAPAMEVAPEPGGETPAIAAMDWIFDAHLHRVVPQKLRIKTDSLLNDFQEVDLSISPERLLMVGLGSAGGLFSGKNAKKKDTIRAAIVDYLASNPTLEKLPGNFKQELVRESLSQLTMIQPSPEGAESLFGDVQIFGTGRIAVRLPKFDEKSTAFLSFTLSQFREFSRLLEKAFGIERFGANCPFPYADHYLTSACYLSNTPVYELQQLEYYQKDPAWKLETTGYRCKFCGAVICEATRQAQKLGGANGKGIAKAKCPKCKKPMGNQPLQKLDGYSVPLTPTASESESAIPDAAAPATSV